MNLFDAKSIAKRLGDFGYAEATFRALAGTVRARDKALDEFQAALKRTMELADAVGFQDTKAHCGEVLKRTRNRDVKDDGMAVHAQRVTDALRGDLKHRKFLHVPAGLSDCVDNERLFGERVWKQFPDARADIQAAGNCLATDCNTAAVFHLMRAVEWALRSFCTDLGIKRLRCKNHKTGKVTYKPIPFSDWEGILSKVEGLVQGRITKLTRGPRKQLLQEFYLPAVQDFKGFRDAFRNHVMHTRRDYTVLEADAIRDRVERFMQTLAARGEV